MIRKNLWQVPRMRHGMPVLLSGAVSVFLLCVSVLIDGRSLEFCEAIIS